MVDRPIDEAVEKHGRRAGQNHADQHKNEDPRRRPAMSRDEERAEREREREDRVRKTDQTQEARKSIFTTFCDSFMASRKRRPRIVRRARRENRRPMGEKQAFERPIEQLSGATHAYVF